MDSKKFYFSFEGRLNRKDFFLKFHLPWLIFGILVMYFEREDMDFYTSLYFALTLWPYFATHTKRFHDFGKSGRRMFFIYHLGVSLISSLIGAGIALLVIKYDLLPEALTYALNAAFVFILFLILIPSLIPGVKEPNEYGQAT